MSSSQERNHRTQDGCWNCAHVLRDAGGYEDADEFYCNVNKDRPVTKCPECDEPIPCMCGKNNDDLQSSLWDAQGKWKDSHDVLVQDVCDVWTRRAEGVTFEF